MKWLIASDIHGSVPCCADLIAAFERERADRLILLGDLFSHGASGGDAKVRSLLNAKKEKILCVRGNCDTDGDCAALAFPVAEDCILLPAGGRTVFFTHGHRRNADRLPPRFSPGDILVSGHTHVPSRSRRGSSVFCNPGSVSLPRGGAPQSYMTFDGERFSWKTPDGEEFCSLRL